MEELKTAPLQAILDAQNYLIFNSFVDYPIGTVFPDGAKAGCGYHRVPGPLVIIGTAAYEEWRVQALRWKGEEPDGPLGPFFYKLTAE